MKKTMYLLTGILFLSVQAFAGGKNENFKVYGNCGMCEKRIEKAALSVEGVSKADWNKETKKIAVVFDDKKTDMHKVQMAIAKAGHDTQMHKATGEAYKNLPACCHYDRNAEKTETHLQK